MGPGKFSGMVGFAEAHLRSDNAGPKMGTQIGGSPKGKY